MENGEIEELDIRKRSHISGRDKPCSKYIVTAGVLPVKRL